MKIDDRIEQSVRALFSAVIKADREKFDNVLKQLSDPASQTKALELTIAVCGFILIDTYGRLPVADEVDDIVQVVVDGGSWVSMAATDVRQFLTCVIERKPLERQFDAEGAFFTAFIVTGTLLGSSPKINEDEWWFNYLDRVEAAIEATPTPS